MITSEADGNNLYPVWSPACRKIAFISDRTGIEQVWVMNADGSSPQQLTTDLVTHDQLPDWSPDGRKIAYEDGGFGSGRIFVMNANGSNPHQLTFGPGDDFGTAWSPDGTQIAFVRDFGNGDRPVYVMNADGSDQHALTGRGSTQFVPAWQPRGERDDGEGNNNCVNNSDNGQQMTASLHNHPLPATTSPASVRQGGSTLSDRVTSVRSRLTSGSYTLAG